MPLKLYHVGITVLTCDLYDASAKIPEIRRECAAHAAHIGPRYRVDHDGVDAGRSTVGFVVLAERKADVTVACAVTGHAVQIETSGPLDAALDGIKAAHAAREATVAAERQRTCVARINAARAALANAKEVLSRVHDAAHAKYAALGLEGRPLAAAVAASCDIESSALMAARRTLLSAEAT